MGRFHSFLFGLVLGGASVFGALKYHVVRAEDGVHFVPKVTPGFQEVYVDIRSFSFDDWNKHRSLAMALVQANQGHLMKDAASGYFRDSIDNVLRSFGGSS